MFNRDCRPRGSQPHSNAHPRHAVRELSAGFRAAKPKNTARPNGRGELLKLPSLQLGVLLGEFNLVGADPNPLQFDLDDVAILEPQLGLAAHADPRGRAREDHVAGQKSSASAEESDGLLHVEDHVGSVAFL